MVNKIIMSLLLKDLTSDEAVWPYSSYQKIYNAKCE